jgi:hypothetical protein
LHINPYAKKNIKIKKDEDKKNSSYHDGAQR